MFPIGKAVPALPFEKWRGIEYTGDGGIRRLKAIDSMRRDWNERARHNAFLYIASWRHDWTEESFFASGEADVQRIVHPILEKLHLNSSVSSMAELGCGAGRMTRAFAKQFQSVTAIEISEEMQRKAQKYLAEFIEVIANHG